MLQYPRLHLFGRFSTTPLGNGVGGPAWCPGAAAQFALRNVHGAAVRGLRDGRTERELSAAAFRLEGEARLVRTDDALGLELPPAALELDGRPLLRLAAGRGELLDFHRDRVAAEQAACGRFVFELHAEDWDEDALPGLVEGGLVELSLVLDAYEESDRNPSHRTGRLALAVGPPVSADEVRLLEPVGGAAVAAARARIHRDGTVSVDLSTALRLQYEGGPLDDFDEVRLVLHTADGHTVELGDPVWIDGGTYAHAADVLWVEVTPAHRAHLSGGRLALRLSADGTELLTER